VNKQKQKFARSPHLSGVAILIFQIKVGLPDVKLLVLFSDIYGHQSSSKLWIHVSKTM